MPVDEPAAAAPAGRRRALLALIAGQVCLHATLTGLRMAAPLLALQRGHGPLEVGALMGLFAAAQIVVALRAGRMADRSGYHRPMRYAVASAFAGGVAAMLAALSDAWPVLQFVLLGIGAALAGAGANIGVITIMRSAGRHAVGSLELKQVFSWLGLAPALANVLGPLLAGALIDSLGFAAACGALALLPLAAQRFARLVPREVPAAAPPDARGSLARSAWQLLRTPGLQRLLLVNWLLSASWDMHSFLLPILGHDRGFSATQIGLILGAFASAVTAVRLLIPWLAHRVSEAQVLVTAMLATALLLGVYPLFSSVPPMMLCAVGLGLALGSVQPMILATLHHLTPAGRHGEAIALRSMTINLSSSLMPLGFGLLGSAIGVAGLFWLMGSAVGAGSWAVRGLSRASAPRAP